MNFIKAKLFMILCLTVAALGIGIFGVGFLVASGNKKELLTIQQLVEEVTSLNNKAVHDDELEQFVKNLALVKEDHQNVLTRIKETTARPLIHPEVFEEDIPAADMFVHYERFADKYCLFIDNLIDQMGGDDKPTDAEEENFRQDHLQQQRGTTVSTGISGAGTEQSQVDRLIVDNQKMRAENIAVYTSSAAFCCYDHWEGKPRSNDHNIMLTDIWYTQVAGWIQEDVVGVIRQINSDSNSIYDSAVKRLLGISFGGAAAEGVSALSGGSTGRSVLATTTTAPTRLGVTTTTGSNQKFLPCYVLAPTASAALVGQTVDPGGLPPGFQTTTTTGAVEGSMTQTTPEHVSDALVNVVHFEINVIIDSSKIHDFINTIQSLEQHRLEVQPDGSTVNRNERNQMAVLQMEVEPLDIAVENKEGYYYGNASVKKLRLICQYLFFRSGYDDVIPSVIKSLLGTAPVGG